jgi:predicted DNA-binding transcriptional regulator YafY
VGVLGAAAERAMGTRGGLPDPDGWTRLELPIESVENAVYDLMRLGADLEVLAPLELRDRIAEIARAMMDRYDA